MCKTLYDAKTANTGYTTSTVAVEIRVPRRGMRQTDVLMGRETMSRYIDADKLIRKYIDTDIKKFSNSDVKIVLENLKQNILKAPSVDIVRCRECKHRPIKEDANEEDYGFNVIAPNEDERCPCLVEDGWYSWIPKDNFYCGYGEREGE